MDQDDERDEENKMVKPIVKDVFFLGQKSEPATKADLQVGRDLQDTLKAHRASALAWRQT